jgi:hypothetical protein
MRQAPDELDALWFAVSERERVEEALAAEALAAGYRPIDPGELAPYGRWLHGEEDPTVRRYAITPGGPRWIGVFPSHPDWDHDFAPAVAGRLGCRAACLMLHDGDVFTLHLHEGERPAASHVSSPVHFDMEPRAEGLLDVDPAVLLPFCREGATADEVRWALTPPGRLVVDGRLAFVRTAVLTYALIVGDDGLNLSEDFEDFHHLAFRFEDEEFEDEPGPGATVLAFPGGCGGGGA